MLSSLAGRQVDYLQMKTAINSELTTRLDALLSEIRTRLKPEVDHRSQPEAVHQLTQAGDTSSYTQIVADQRKKSLKMG